MVERLVLENETCAVETRQNVGLVGSVYRDLLGFEGVSKEPSRHQSSPIPQQPFYILVTESRGILTPDNLIELGMAPFARGTRPLRDRSCDCCNFGGRGSRLRSHYHAQQTRDE